MKGAIPPQAEAERTPVPHLQRYLLAGVFTVIPIWITWVVFDFFLRQLSRFGAPWVRALSRSLDQHLPTLAEWMLAPWFQSTLAVLLTLLALYGLGLMTTHLLGRRLIGAMDRAIARIPLVQTIYGSTKRLLAALQHKPDGVQRVVLIEFPSPQMKAVGFVTRVFRDADTGAQLAAVYVPTTPNPTSGYVEIVPVERLVCTDWTLDEAMGFIISGGAVAPEQLRYSQSGGRAPETPGDEAPARAAGPTRVREFVCNVGASRASKTGSGD